MHRLNEDVIQVPKCLIDLAAKMENDPDPNLDSTYNWYYAGNGNLQLICVNWVDYLLHSEFSVLCKYLVFGYVEIKVVPFYYLLLQSCFIPLQI